MEGEQNMQRKNTILTALLPVIILVPIVLLMVLLPKGGKTGNYSLTGRYIETTSGQHMIYRNTDTGEMRYVFMISNGEATMFDDFETGDAIRVQSEPRIQETDDGINYARVYNPEKVRESTKIPELTEDVLSHVESLSGKFNPAALS